MRPEATARLGFYPAPPEAIELLLSRLVCHPEGAAIIDPCAGKAIALKQIADGLGVPDEKLYAIELEMGRADDIKQLLPKANVLAPASLFGCSISSRTFGLTYVNPPFADDAAKGRVEITWLQRCLNLLCHRGIMVFVCPEATSQLSEFRLPFVEYCDNITVLPFPEKVRKHKEVFVIGVRRKESVDAAMNSFKLALARPEYRYNIPSAPGPGRFVKTQLTDGELEELMTDSPLHSHLSVPPMAGLPRPPLALHTGHLALLLSCGSLDGVVHPPDGPSHVIRGVARKREEETEREESKTKTEKVIKATITERIELVVRAVDTNGQIHTLT